ncbi:MAG: cyclase family protein [Rhodospirillaceae bacterium]|nr:cyclase family protein [Rhodospirillaceae bacterium]
MKILNLYPATLAVAAFVTAGAIGHFSPAQAQSNRDVVAKSKSLVPSPPWAKGDQVGMANTLGPGTWMRCAAHLTNPKSKTYEVSHVRSNTMPGSPFGVPLKYKFRPTASVPYSKHAFNGEQVTSGEPGAQGTQMDALGHFAFLGEMWKGKGAIPVDTASYYGGFKQSDVKPTPASPLMKLGIENVPPIITSAVLLNAKTHLGGGQAMKPGQMVTTKDIEAMIKAQGLGWRGLLPGDVLYIYTGWSDNWQDPDVKKVYYTKGPGLSYDAAQYLRKKNVVLLALDNPFTDPVFEGQLVGKHGPPKGTPPALPFAIHHENLAVSGIHQIQNANLAAMARDKVWTSCTIILPLRSKGGSGSPVRPVAIGAPGQS